jgi:hypothetical protein
MLSLAADGLLYALGNKVWGPGLWMRPHACKAWLRCCLRAPASPRLDALR